jgi:putative SOS response-associated peptidase YedK
MPVVVAPDEWNLWLDPSATPSDVLPLLIPPPETALRARPVTTRVNDVRNNDASLLDDAPPPPEALSLF